MGLQPHISVFFLPRQGTTLVDLKVSFDFGPSIVGFEITATWNMRGIA
jgi:hypothetical protein